MSVMLVTSAIVLSLMCSAYIILEYFSYRETLKNNVTTLGKVIASNSAGALAFLSVKDANEILSALEAESHIKRACIYDNNGEIFAKYPDFLLSGTFPPATSRIDGFYFENNFLNGFVPIEHNRQQLGLLYIQTDLTAMYDQLKNFAIIGILLIVASLFVAFILSNRLQKTISIPILSLQQTAKIISTQNDYSVRATKHGNDEVGALADTFNQMLRQIQINNAEITAFSQNLEVKVSERTKALEQQKDFVETILNASVDIIVVFDKDLNYIMMNRLPENYTQLTKEEIIGKNLLGLFPSMEGSEFHLNLLAAIKGETIHNAHFKSRETHRTFENFFIPLRGKNNEVYGVLTMNHDVTQIAEANEALESLNSELLKSNRELEQFAYVASHDLQEPLRKIQTFTQLLSRNLDDAENRESFLTKINQSANRMQQLIKDVLNFSRISNSEDAFVETDLNHVLETLKVDFELIFREKGAELHYTQLPKIKGIPLQLTQIFSNLISNSLKYTKESPVIRISHDTMTPDDIKKHPMLVDTGKYTKILFSDNGIGFEPQFSEQIFDIFQRLHGRETYSGTGIGLALCKKIAENHHGIIYAEGEPNKGATFTIILPS
ncbi:MAG: ATP-binding protein [Bacteroidota bacterium]|nr:ATP-binding protein [Bacteroidota bacterium]